jgi:hypothetical protein
MRSPKAFYTGLFIVAATTLMLQVVFTRILSLVAWYHLAFFVVSLAMFGLTVGAVYVYLRRARFTEETVSRDLAHYSVLFAYTAALSIASLLTLSPVTVMSLTTVFLWTELAVFVAVPFFFSGIVVSLALTRSPLPIGRVYAADLIGAALGCLAVLLLLNVTDAVSAILWTSLLIAVGGFFFLKSATSAPETQAAGVKAWLAPQRAAVVLLGFALLNEALPDRNALRPVFVKGKVESGNNEPRYEKWNSFSRIGVHPVGVIPAKLTGPGKDYRRQEWKLQHDRLKIDGGASSLGYHINGDLERAGFLRYDIAGLAYEIPGIQESAVIGVGGGRDLLTARVYGVPHVTGVEINPIIANLLTEEPGFADVYGVKNIPGIDVEVAEARSWFASTDRTFDSIQMSLIDTFAATGAGAYTLSENGLYTTEAWNVFVDRLNPGGVFTVTRWYAPGEVVETGRMVSLAVASVLELGATDPRQHLFLAVTPPLATLVLGRDPLTADQVTALEAACARHGFEIIASPQIESPEEFMRDLLGATNAEELAQRTVGYQLDLSPPTDERPFFFNQLPLGNPVATFRLWRELKSQGVTSGNLTATATLLLLLLISAGLVVATVVVPLRPAARDSSSSFALGGTCYFFLIGIGFMCTEIGLLQRMSVFLGHPIYSLSVVLFALILTTGLGSLLSDRFPLDRPKRFYAWALLTSAYLTTFPLWVSGLLLEFDRLPLTPRALFCVAVIAPAGILMGFGFPTGMRLASAVDKRPTPWFWGVNGAAGVLASSLAVACSIAYGISFTLMAGGVCYLLLILVAGRMGLTADRSEQAS